MSCWLNMKNLIYINIIVLFAKIVVCAQTVSFVEYIGEKKFLINTGKEALIELYFRVKDNYHIQANQLNDENLIPTTLNLTGPDNFAAGKALFPPPEKFLMTGTDEQLDVFSNQFKIYVPVKINNFKTQDKHSLVLNGNLFYQACDSVKCYYPRNLDFLLNIEIID